MNEQPNHLTDRQIERYIDVCVQGPAENQDEIEAHFEDCDFCRGRYIEAERVRLGILDLHPAKIPYPECPDDVLLQKYASGSCSSEIAAKLRTHAARCDFCAPRLKQYLKDFSEELLQEAKDLHGRLPASTKEWRQGFVRKHVVGRPTFLQRLKDFFSFFRVPGLVARVSVASGLAMVLFAVFLLPTIVANNQIKQINQAEKLTVEAFVENPTTDLRYAWTPEWFDTKLGGARGTTPVERHAFIKVQFLADEKRNSGNPKWLRIRGRLALLNKDASAVTFLKSAYDKGLQDPSTEIDLAAAYFLRDTSEAGKADEDSAKNVAATVDLLQKVLKKPDLTPEQQAAALFNLAVAYEAMHFWNDAVSVWEKYLALDATGPWAEEAKRHRAQDQSQIPPPRPEESKTPHFFEDHYREGETQKVIEEYQDAALRNWFLDRTHAERAIRTLAETLEEQHQDPWMKEFLKHTEAEASDWAGIQALSAAITSNKRGAPTEARQHAQNAQAVFERTGNLPGRLRSRFEEVYANQRLLGAKPCVQQAQQLDADLRGTPYRWLQVQVALTRAACLYLVPNSEAAEEQLKVGYQDAGQFGFHILKLRAMALEAGASSDCNENWHTAAAGLDLYWHGPSVPMRLYEFYSMIEPCLEKKRLWHAAEALYRRMSNILENEIDRNDQDVSFLESARNNRQKILIAENESGPNINWSPCRKDPVCATYQLPTRLDLAELQLGAGDTQAARRTLEEAQGLVASTTGDLIRLSFYRRYGDVLLEQHQLDDAGAAYKAGLEIAEQAFAGLKNNERRQQWTTETGEIYRGMVGTLLRQGQPEQALQLWEWYQARPWDAEADRLGEAGPISWPQIESAILRVPVSVPNSGTRLVYAIIKDRIHIWTITPSGMKVWSSDKITRKQVEELERRIGDYAQEISSETSNIVSLQDDSQWLFSLLLTPVLMDLHERGTVVAELDPLMNKLNLLALESPEGWYFGLRYPVVNSPGMVEENKLRPVSHRPPTSSWLLNALTADNRSPIEGLKGIEILNARNMTTSGFSDRLRDGDMFVFVGHGESGGLRMPNREPLQAEDFPPQSLQKLQLAALVACSSGSTQNGLLDTRNLVHALLSGGVPQIIASQWDVSRKRTDTLIGSFHRHFQSGDTVAGSMMLARQEVYQAGNSHPYYWAAFSLFGRAN